MRWVWVMGACAVLSACGPRVVTPKVILSGSSISIVDAADESVPIHIPFRVDSDQLDENAVGVLHALAIFLKDSPNLTLVEVQGHSDERGSSDYNMGLSRRRAHAVVGFLVERGIAKRRLRSKGFGASKPLMRGKGESAWGQNRRVEFHVVATN